MASFPSPRSEAEVTAVLEEFEQRHRVFELTIGGISLWRILRFEISFTMQNLGLSRPMASRREILASMFSAVRQLIVAPRGIQYLGATMSSALRTFDGRGWRDIYFDPIIDGIGGGGKMLYVDAPGFEQHARGAVRQPVFNDTSVVALSAVLGRIFGVRGHVDVFQKLSQTIINDLDLPEFTAERIRRKYSVLIWRSWLYRIVLRRLRPGCVMIPNSGQFALFLAARALGIPFVEMQHGIFSENHPDSLPAAALEFDQGAMLLPDFLTVYGSWWGDLLKDSALGRLGRIREVGASWIESARALRQRQFSTDPDRPVVTLTSQGTGVEQLADFVAAFLKLCPGPLQFNIRLHPGYEIGTSHYESRFSGDDRVKLWPGNSRPDTFEMIAMSDLHLSVSSACHYEALGIGTPTGVLALPGHELVLDLVRRNDAALVDNPSALATLIENRAWPTVSNRVSDQYFRRGHIENIRALLAECGNMGKIK
ncbi:hypothetical protein ML401_23135 [Bradyrhizobium sp. 62B]|uniref:hypothetical protein n=1 Tax=Bradyrhizobium sp. 62B TaxID=2898442 RepID=UPI002558133F|nr:hypothetical protein ML401_23135 [Bradyrhizobium sp. 62B]